jgi:dTDP-4-amino-4,6-dideoxygalactose transaminase
VNWPIVTDADKRAVMKVLDEGRSVWAATTAHRARDVGLERNLRRHRAKHALACNGGTAALHGDFGGHVGPGDEVITTVLVPRDAGVGPAQQRIPIFADIDPRTYIVRRTSSANHAAHQGAAARARPRRAYRHGSHQRDCEEAPLT